jgi:hypothetical protein
VPFVAWDYIRGSFMLGLKNGIDNDNSRAKIAKQIYKLNETRGPRLVREGVSTFEIAFLIAIQQ